MLIIADNQPLTRDALTGYFADQPVHHAASKSEVSLLLEKWTDATIILDFTLFDFSTPENFLIYLRRFPKSHWLLLSSEFSENLIRLLSSEPQVSFLTKDCNKTDVLQAVYRISQGEQVICDTVRDALRSGFGHENALVQLTPTENEILSLIAQGLTAKAIAEKRHSSVHTIVTHKKNIFRKIGVSTAYEATRYALRAGVADPVEYYI